MKAKTIKSVLRRKFDAWINSIESDTVVSLVKRDALITGGSIASMLLSEKVSDYDVYFKTQETALAVAQYYLTKFKENPPNKFKNTQKLIHTSVIVEDGRVKIVVKSAGIAGEQENISYQYFEQVEGDIDSQEFVDDVTSSVEEATTKDESKPKFRPIFLTSNAITLSNSVQIVIRFYGDVDVIHENYDFTHCKCSWEAETGELRLPPDSLECLLSKELKYTTSKYPLCSIIRIRKFLSRGWTINAGQIVKMAWDLNKLDLSDIKVLEEQMVGVDAAYFHEVIAKLKEHGGDKVDGAYLIQIIDKVF